MAARQKVLMIDDEKLMHTVVKARLADDGIDFHSATSGHEGIALARQIKPDVILLDVQMAQPDGFEVCRQLKADSLLSPIPIIFLTAITSTEDKVRGLNLGAIDYITKPFDAAELQARVRAALRTKELTDMLSTRAMIDGLTGLWNRAYFDARLGAQIAEAKRHAHPFSCILADADRFKLINDTHGHGFGDFVLRGLARLMQESCRAEDVVCRYGGEEFAILTPGVSASSAAQFAERLRHNIERQPFTRNGLSISVTCSFGIADAPLVPEGLTEASDKALYQSKSDGRNRVTVSDPKKAAA